jgi:hypothetical protein
VFADMLGHAEGIWRHLVGWSRDHSHGGGLVDRAAAIEARFESWRAADPLAQVRLSEEADDG